MSKISLSVGTFADLLDQWGPDLARWPQQQRSDADALLGTSPEAAALLAEALALDDALRNSQPKAPAGLADRIVAASGSDKPKG